MKEKWVCILLTTSLTVLLLFGMIERQQPRPVFSTGSELPILVLDAGHGGFDGGAVGADGRWNRISTHPDMHKLNQ